MHCANIVKNIDSAADLLQAVSSTQRLTILVALFEGERSAGALGIITGMRQAALSQHLSKLRRAGLVHRRRHGRNALYRCESVVAKVLLEAVAEMSSQMPPEEDNANILGA